MLGNRTPAIRGKVYPPSWWTQREIRVFWEESINREAVDLVLMAVDKRIKETIGWGFTFLLLGNHPSALDQLRCSTSNGQVNDKKLFDLAISEEWRDLKRGGRQHADIFITSKPFVNDMVSWGSASFKYGAMIFSLHGSRQENRQFLYQVALHETNHLLGMYCHCDDYPKVANYQYSPDCNMHGSCPSSELCPKCMQFIRLWWQQIIASQPA
jgi:hypothetical protein